MLNFTKSLKLLLISLMILSSTSCSDAGDLLSLAFNPPSRKEIDRSLLAVNNFFVDPEFGNISQQYSEITKTLKINRIRVLFAWTDDVQPSPGAAPNYSFYDSIANSAPAGTEILVVLSHAPSWITNPANLIDNDARTTWIERWFKPTVNRYKNNPNIVGFEIFNEPDIVTLEQDNVLGLTTAENYFDLLSRSYNAGKSITSSKLMIMAATTSIQRNFPNVLNYNKKLRDLGVDAYTDIWNVHYYASSYETVVTSNGVGDFLNGVSKPIWVTESGEKDQNKQLSYVETTWPFLKDEIPGIQRFYYYQFGETGPLNNNFGLRTTDSNFPVSNLYLYLRDGTR